MKRLFLNIKYFVLVKLGKLRCSGWKVYPNGVRCCGCGDCKKEVPDEKAESAVNGKICNTCKGNGEWVDVEFREITICPDCNGTGIISKTCHTLKVNNGNMNLYTVVTGEIRAGDVSWWIDKTLTPVNPFWIGKNTSDVEVIVFRPVKVPSEEELDKAVPCAKTMTCPPNMPINTTCIKCHRETMLRLMGIEPEQAKE